MGELNTINRLKEGIEKYSSLLNKLDIQKDKQNLKVLVLKTLVARDNLQKLLSQKDENLHSDIEELFVIDEKLKELDEKLKKHSNQIAISIDLDKWRDRLKIEDDAWWWFFTPDIKISKWNKLDWLWNSLSIVALALTASLMVNIFKAFSVGSLTVAATFSAFAQIGGLAILSRGALTEQGQKQIQRIISKFNIPPKFQAEAVLAFSLILLSSVFYAQSNLDKYYYNDGIEIYKTGDLNNAEVMFLKGLEIDPDNSEFNQHLGTIYESLGLLEEALKEYGIDVKGGNLESINALGRTLINRVNPTTRKTDPALAEAFLITGLQRVRALEGNENLKYQLNRNIGWAMIEQKKYEKSIPYLEEAIEMDKKISDSENVLGRGLGYCFLAYSYESLNDLENAKKNYKECVIHGKPETIHEFRWFIKNKKDEIANCIDTTDIIFNEATFSKEDQKNCQLLFK